jgi:hypothetical protein
MDKKEHISGQKSKRLIAFIATCLLLSQHSVADEPIQFGRDILPILSANCFACHGPDEHDRQADLRLDLESDAKKEHGDGFPIVPSHPDKSTLIARITSTDPESIMPPPKANKTLKKEQIELLRKWIAAGGTWGTHWSFEPIRKPEVAKSDGQPIDVLVQRVLAKRGLKLQPPATAHNLVRRLSLDLIGLPPSPETADRFAANPSPTAYEKLVDELLQSPQFGEHWARMWLDIARYADTKGYEKDLGRTMWPYRDWVIGAFNADMPLDRFTEEQLAGDLLPTPTKPQLIATAFHRNTMSNDEGGTDDEEFRIAAVKDRIDTTMQAWMGLTMGCAKCHSHKYDPISQVDYYRFYALFNQTEDADRPDDAPRMAVLNDQQLSERDQLLARILKAEQELKHAVATQEQLQDKSPWRAASVVEAKSENKAILTPQPNQAIQVSGQSESEDVYTIVISLPAGRHTAVRLEALPEKLTDGQLGLGRNEADPNFVVSEFKVELLNNTEDVKPLKLSNPRADYSQNNWPVSAAIDGNLKTGWAVSPRYRERHAAVFDFTEPLQLTSDSKLRITIEQRYGERLTLRNFRLSTSEAEVKSLPLLEESPEVKQLRERLVASQGELKKLEASQIQLPIMRELAANKQRVTKIHKRGNFLDQGDVVTPAVLPAFGKLTSEAPLNRLGAARWLVNRDNPLTPRVWANRVWARLFGIGIVETEEDLGALGSPPTNPELLNWLAAEYRDGGWSLKKLLKTIVLSETYRQSSQASEKLVEIDPRNAIASRGARYRLTAEVVRDQALTVSGLISLKMGGPPVMPPQPEGLWRSTYSGQKWVNAEGEDRFRRGLYTYLKRTTPFPSFTTFDAGSGEVCQIRRIRTNTPLQALITLNDPVFLEAAAALAKRMVNEATDTEARAARGLRLALIRPVREGEVQPLVRLYHDAEKTFAAAPEKAKTLLEASRAKPDNINANEFAAWIVTANAILNLDEFLSRN